MTGRGRWISMVEAAQGVYVNPDAPEDMREELVRAIVGDTDTGTDTDVDLGMCEGCGTHTAPTSWSDHAWCDDCNGRRSR